MSARDQTYLVILNGFQETFSPPRAFRWREMLKRRAYRPSRKSPPPIHMNAKLEFTGTFGNPSRQPWKDRRLPSVIRFARSQRRVRVRRSSRLRSSSAPMPSPATSARPRTRRWPPIPVFVLRKVISVRRRLHRKEFLLRNCAQVSASSISALSCGLVDTQDGRRPPSIARSLSGFQQEHRQDGTALHRNSAALSDWREGSTRPSGRHGPRSGAPFHAVVSGVRHKK